MRRIVYLLTLTAVFVLELTYSFGQSRWVKVYHDEIDAVGDKMIESYDHGYFLLGRYGHNYPKYLWLIKTDINGNILWEKTIGDGLNAIVFLDMAQDDSGIIYLAGTTLSYDPEGDPLIMKLDSCGEKEWCKVFYTENNNDFSSCFTLSTDGSVAIVLNYTNPEPHKERICVAKLSPEGNLLWKHCYTSADTNQRDEESYDLIQTPDKGFLVSGFCYYEDPTYPNHWIPHPYFLKVDSIGNFEWETVVYKETNLDGGVAGSTAVSPNLQYYYSSISHYYYDTNLTSAALVKMDMDGNVISVFDVIYGYKYGKLAYANFLNDSILAASAGWGNSDEDLWSRAVIIDTLGNLLNSTVLMQDLYTSILQVAYNGKLVYMSNTFQNGQFDVYLRKLNQNLEDDTIYTMPFTYDSLCPYQILSDTIVQDDCGLIVGIEEDDKTVGRYDGKTGGLEVWPNPCRGMLNVECLMLNEGKDYNLSIYDIFGRLAPIPSPSPTRGKGDSWVIDVSALPPGIYLAVLREGLSILTSTKFIIAR
ncbi:MAG: hypothetical protein M0Q51_17110 [Bacteroidales bacterium]|nr:hypothetical protein [Bacteroidales bacterium]